MGLFKELDLKGSSPSKRERKLSAVIHNQREELARVIRAKDKAWNRAIREAASMLEQGNTPEQVARRARVLSLLRRTEP